MDVVTNEFAETVLISGLILPVFRWYMIRRYRKGHPVQLTPTYAVIKISKHHGVVFERL